MKSWVVDPATSRRFRLVAPIAGGGFAPPAGGAGLLVGETDGFSADFLYPDDTKRVAVKTAGSVVSYAPDSFIANAGTSPKMVYDVNGVLGWSPHNYCLRSEDFTNASWQKTFLASVTAHTLQETDTGGAGFAGQSFTTIVGASYTISTWFLKDTDTSCFPGVFLQGTLQCLTHVNTSTGATVNEINNYNATVSVEDTGTYWKLNQTFTADVTSTTYRIYAARAIVIGAFTNAAVGTVTVDRVQFARGATAYLPTTTAARYGLAIDYDPVNHSPKGLLMEPAATNLQKGTATLADAAIWFLTGSTVTSAGTAPTGATAFALTEDTSGLSHNIVPVNGQGAGITAGTVYTTSGYVKANGRTRCRFFSSAFNNLVVFFDLTGGTYDNVSGGTAPSARINPVGNGWYRFEVTDQAIGTQARPSFDLCNGGTTVSYTGNGTSGVYLWNHMQIETGTVASSSIPTYAASATRATDVYNVTPASINYSATVGSWMIDCFIGSNTANSARIFGYSSGATPISIQGPTVFQFFDSSAGGANFSKSVPTSYGPHKISTAFQVSDAALTADGISVATSTSTGATTNSLAPGALIAFGNTPVGGSPVAGYIRQLRYVPRRKTNAELQAETEFAPASDLLLGETDGFATDFLYAPAAKKVAVKASRVVTEYGVDAFYQNAGTSPKMVWDAAGVLGWSPHNMVLNSQTFNVANWSIAGTVSLTADTIAAPDGTITGDKLNSLVSGASFHSMPNTPLIGIVVGETYTLSIYAKAAEVSWLGLETNNTNLNVSYFDLINGVVGTRAGIHIASSITAISNGWYRCSVTYLPSGSANPTIHVSNANNVASSTISIGSGIYIWGAQLNRGSVALPYLPTTTAARFGLALDYDPVTHVPKGLLCEPAATNFCTQSAGGRIGFEWTGNSSTFTGGQPDPSGKSEALNVVITNNAAGINVGRQAGGLTIATTYMFSCWCKGTAGQQIYFGGMTLASNILVTFTGAWQRVSNAWAATATAEWTAFECFNRSGGAHLPAVTFQVWGGQCETSTLPTSYIPTFAASATRAGDQYKLTPAAINHSATAGSWWVNTETRASVGVFIGQVSANFPSLYIQNATQIGLFDGNILSKSGLSTVGLHKFMSAYQASDRALTGDGLAPVTDTNSPANLLATTGISIGFGGGGGTNINGYFRKLCYVPRRKTNAEMQTDTL